MTDSTKICKVWTQMPIPSEDGKKIRENKFVEIENLTMSVIYIKYPLEDDYVMMTLSKQVRTVGGSRKDSFLVCELNDKKYGMTDVDTKKVHWVDDRCTDYMPFMLMPTKDQSKLVYFNTCSYG